METGLSTFSRVLWVAWRGKLRLQRWLRKATFYSAARLEPGVTFLETSRVTNIRGDRDAIRVGAGTVVGGELLTFRHGGSIQLGAWCFVGEGTRVWSAQRIEIGDRVLISHGVNIHDCDSHPKDHRARHAQFHTIATAGHPSDIDTIDSAPVIIEDDAWIGFNATILKGVCVGARSIVAACSVVTRDVPQDSVFIGDKVVDKIE